MMQKRVDIRRATIVPTEVMSPYWLETVDLVAADLSPFGMYLISDTMPKVGEFIFCTFALSINEPEFRVLSKVKRLNLHRRKTDRLRPGFGVQFLGVDENSKNKIRTALRGLPPPVPSSRRILVQVPRPTWIPVVPKPTAVPIVPRPSLVVPKPSWDYAAAENPGFAPPEHGGAPLPKPKTMIQVPKLPFEYLYQ